MNAWKTTVVVVILGILTTGCGDDCVDVCERVSECEGSTQAEKEQDCELVCDVARENADALGCSFEIDDVYSCIAGVDDVCADYSDCEVEIDAYSACAG